MTNESLKKSSKKRKEKAIVENNEEEKTKKNPRQNKKTKSETDANDNDNTPRKKRKMNEAREKVVEKKMKRKEEEQEKAKKNLEIRKKQAQEYLSNWKHHRDVWKFNKSTQNWILKYLFDRKKISKNLFKDSAFDYVNSIQGASKARVQEDAKSILKEVLQGNDSLDERVKRLIKKKKGDAHDDAVDTKLKDVRSKYKRARLLLRETE